MFIILSKCCQIYFSFIDRWAVCWHSMKNSIVILTFATQFFFSIISKHSVSQPFAISAIFHFVFWVHFGKTKRWNCKNLFGIKFAGDWKAFYTILRAPWADNVNRFLLRCIHFFCLSSSSLSSFFCHFAVLSFYVPLKGLRHCICNL